MATSLARLVYRMLRYGMQYGDQGAKFYTSNAGSTDHVSVSQRIDHWRPGPNKGPLWDPV
jgi:hypothetical protein